MTFANVRRRPMLVDASRADVGSTWVRFLLVSQPSWGEATDPSPKGEASSSVSLPSAPRDALKR